VSLRFEVVYGIVVVRALGLISQRFFMEVNYQFSRSKSKATLDRKSYISSKLLKIHYTISLSL